MKDPITALEDWYFENCDGDWEHEWSVRIQTLDNPGWMVKINLEGTDLEGKTFDRREVERSEDDWFFLWVEERVFQGRGGPKNLREILSLFLSWSTK